MKQKNLFTNGETILLSKYKIEYTSKAQSDYYNMLEHSLSIHFNYYRKIYEEFHSKIQNLLENPYIYPIIENKKEFRKTNISNYIIVYKICNNIVIVYRIFLSKIQYTKYIY